MKESILHHVYKISLLEIAGKHGSLKRAALEAGITTSALSQNIATLELFTGKTLLHRKKEGVQLSPEGADFVSNFAPLIASLEKLKPDRSETPPERISIGAYDSIAMTVFPKILGSLRKQIPNLRLNVHMGRSHALYSAVKSGELDMAMVVDAQDDVLVDVHPLTDERLGVYCSSRHSIAERGLRAIEDVGIATVSPSPVGHPLYYQKFCRRLGDPTVVVATDSFETVRSILLSGSVAGILPTRVAGRNPEELREITPPGLEPGFRGEHSFSLISRRNIDVRMRDFVLAQIRAAFEVDH